MVSDVFCRPQQTAISSTYIRACHLLLCLFHWGRLVLTGRAKIQAMQPKACRNLLLGAHKPGIHCTGKPKDPGQVIRAMLDLPAPHWGSLTQHPSCRHAQGLGRLFCFFLWLSSPLRVVPNPCTPSMSLFTLSSGDAAHIGGLWISSSFYFMEWRGGFRLLCTP